MKIILSILTHGDERIGLKVAGEIEKLGLRESVLSVQVGNQKAFERGKRFIDQDLNRSFPGRSGGNHEQQVAFRLSPAIKSADVVIDIHSTVSELKDAIIVTKLDRRTRDCIEAICPRYALVMNATKGVGLIDQARVGLAFEYGKDGDPLVLKEVVDGLGRLFRHLGVIEGDLPGREVETEFFDVFAEVNKPDGYRLLENVENFGLIRRGEPFATDGDTFLTAKEDFYPILFGRDNYKSIFGFSGRKVF